MYKIFITIIIAYSFGSFQTAYLVSKIFKKVDIRTLGNKNPGASNTVASLGWKYGILVALLDILKPIVSILLIEKFFLASLSHEELMSYKYLNGLFVILGHDYPFYLDFKGGKGTASLIGTIISISPIFGLVTIISILSLTLITGYIALGTIFINVLFFIGSIYIKAGPLALAISFLIMCLSIYKHIENINNILNKKEKPLKNFIKKTPRN